MDEQVDLPACGQGITVPTEAVCSANGQGGMGRSAAVAQLVERVLGKDEVMGPSPISSYMQASRGAAADGARAGP